MTVEIHTFKEWMYPFIAQDYEGEFNLHNPNTYLAGLVLEESDVDTKGIVENFIRMCDAGKIDAFMIELSWIDEVEAQYADSVCTKLAKELGYKDLKSYEHRLAYGRKE